jgi:hypothetical protein
MRRLAWLVLCGLGVLGWENSPSMGLAQKKDDPKSNLVVLDNVKSMAPAEWKRDKLDNLLLKHQFRLAKVKDDKLDAQVFISEVIGAGTPDKKILGWREMFEPPAGKTIDDVSRIEKMKLGRVQAIYLDVHGTYLWKKRPQDPPTAAVPRPGHRMLAVYFDTGDTPYFIRMIGPAETVAHYKQGFDEWLKAFK